MFFEGQTATDSILANLALNAPMGMDKIIYNAVKDWLRSDERAWMITGERYYRDYPDIVFRKKYGIGPNGEKIEIPNVANNKLVHNFTKKLIDQKVGYLLSKPITVQTENEAYEKVLTDDFFGKEFQRLIQRIGKESIQKGKGWLHVYYDENGDFRMKRIPSHEVIPLWRDTDHTELDAIIRVYEYTTYEAQERKVVTKVEYWDQTGVQRLVYQDDRIVPDIAYDSGWRTTHFTVVNPDGSEQPYNWSRVPFICFKYNAEELPLLHQIKSLVDDYDKQKSDNSSNLEDTPNEILVLRNYDGQDLGEFRQNLAAFRAVKVTDDGGVDSLGIDINTGAYTEHQKQNRKDIYEFGRGVDTQSENFGGDKSGIALKFLYADLDMDCNMIETEYQWSLEQLLWFIDAHLDNSGYGDFSKENVTFIFNRDILINETEAITNAMNSVGIESMETIVANHPWTTNTKDELDRKEKEKKDDMLDYPSLGGGGGNDSNQGDNEGD